MERRELEALIREVLGEMRACGVQKVALADVAVAERDRLDTGNPADRVYTHDVLTLTQSPRLGCGVMEMTKSDFPWTLSYDEVDYVISGELTIRCGGQCFTARAGEMLFIPKGSSIHFCAPGHARFLYVTYPADW